MNLASPKGEETIFAEALRLPANERSGYLDQVTSGQPELRRRVEVLLGSYGAGDFLEKAASPQLRQTPHVAVPVTEKSGDTIGRYKLLQQIGEGGCGVVYMAEQAEPMRRRVALKIIKLGMDTKSVIARFEAERQALAMMDHPNIAKVFDAGATATGRPYFVMELVRGMKITEFCDEKKLSTRQRLDLFIQVCQAIQHAHQKGIIHRDIKPSNILVTVNDGVPVPKVIDFGIAKATSGQQLTDKTLFTAFEQFIGTPAYMSPEQAVLTSLDIDTRSDIYALGVLLYELLTGQTPFDAKELLAIGLDEMRRTIREQEPPRPSTRLSTLPGRELSTTAQRRSLDAPKLVSELRGDLDWIVMKALEKDRSRRYETANGLAADIRRHLNSEPVLACPPGKLYRLQKTVRRNKLAFSAAAAVLATLVIGLGISTWMFLRERDALKRAVAAEQAERKLRQEAELRDLNTHAFRVLELESAVTARRKALEAQRRLLGNEHSDVADSLEQLERLLRLRRNFSEAEQAGREALAIRRSNASGGDLRVAESLQRLAVVLEDEGEWTEQEQLMREAVNIRRRIQGGENVETALTINDLAVSLERQKKTAESLASYKEAFTLCRKRLPEGDPRLALVGNNLIWSLIRSGKRSEAETLIREFVPGNLTIRPELTGTVSEITDEAFKAGKFEDGEKLLNDLLSKLPDGEVLLDLRAQYLARGGRSDAALSDYRRLIELKPDRNNYWRKHAALLALTKQQREYDEFCRRFLEKFNGTADPELIERLAKACLLLPGSPENTRAAIHLADRLDARSKKNPWIACVKGLAEYRRGQFQAALEYMRQASEVYQRSACEAQTCAVAAMAHYQLNQMVQAGSALTRAKDLASYGRNKLKKGDADSWDDWLRVLILVREAGTLIEGNSSTEIQTQ